MRYISQFSSTRTVSKHSPDLLRVIRKGPAVKRAVDDAIDRCSAVYNLREAIEESRVRAEEATDDKLIRLHTSKGMYTVCRLSICFDQRSRSTKHAPLLRVDCFSIVPPVNRT